MCAKTKMFILLFTIATTLDINIAQYACKPFVCPPKERNENINRYSNCSVIDITNFSYILRKENEFGILNANITLPSVYDCGFSKYSIRLYVLENITSKTDCNNNAIIELDQRHHTDHEFCNSLNTTCNSSPVICNENIEVDFWFVFTGCYQIEIRPIKGQSSGMPSSTDSFWIDSHYSKHYLRDYTPILHAKKDNVMNEITVIAKFNFTWVWNISIELEDSNFNDDRDFFMDPISCSMCNDGSSDAVCKPNNANYTCSFLKNDPDARTTIQCIFPKVNFTNYTATLFAESNGAQCHGLSLWKADNCAWELRNYAPLPGQNITYSTEDNAKPIHIIIPAVFIGSVLMVCLGYCYIWHYRKTNYVDPTIRRTIFLVYARDCEAIMRVISGFSSVLIHAANFEVYDIFNNKYFDEISLSPKEWVQSKLENSDFVFFISTKCGQTLFKYNLELLNSCKEYAFNGHLLSQKCSYNLPECFDNLFIHAYKISSKWDNFYMIQFNKISKYIIYKSMQPVRRGHCFKIPKQFSKLFKELSIKNMEETMDSEHYHQFIHRLNEAKLFLSENENYLSQLLMHYSSEDSTSLLRLNVPGEVVLPFVSHNNNILYEQVYETELGENSFMKKITYFNKYDIGWNSNYLLGYLI